MVGGPLEGVRVLDLSHTLAGPFATMLLADLGADVVKVEPPGGDETRTWAPHVGGESAYFMSANRGKRSIAVNLKDPLGREVVYRLARRSDVVIENYRPGVREKLGVDPESLTRVNPRLVYVSVKGFRPGSSYESRPAYDIIVQAMSGLMATTGEEGRPPVRCSFALFDIITGALAALYAVSALYAGRRPSYIEVPLFDAAVFAMSYIPMMYLLTGRKPRRMGSAHPSIVPYQAFQAGDGRWFILAAANDRHWRRFAEAVGRPELAEDERFATNPDRVRNRHLLIPILEELFRGRSRDEWVRLLSQAGVPVAPVYELDELFSDPYTGEIVEELPHPKLGRVKQLAEPARIDGWKPMSTRHPPLLGEHTVEILEELGYSRGEIEELIRRGAVVAAERR
ncbi:MAG: CoA transferase [Desulfurococcales archaeon]|nr:CoA transferase [Desulfurococcales archaeon]